MQIELHQSLSDFVFDLDTVFEEVLPKQMQVFCSGKLVRKVTHQQTICQSFKNLTGIDINSLKPQQLAKLKAQYQRVTL